VATPQGVKEWFAAKAQSNGRARRVVLARMTSLPRGTSLDSQQLDEERLAELVASP
jgi:hypothetical protein